MNRFLMIIFLLGLAVPLQAQETGHKISPRLEQAIVEDVQVLKQNDGRWGVWVHFTDKGLADNDLSTALAAAEQNLPERTRQRRSKMVPTGNRLVNLGDLPLAGDYLAEVAATGAEPRQQSLWLNAASFNATKDQIDAIAALPCVEKVTLVARFSRPDPEVSELSQAEAAQVRQKAETAAEGSWTLGYGGSTAGLEQINVPPLHEIGLTGTGIVIGMLDGGFRTTHQVFQGLSIQAQWDFVDDDPIVDEEPGEIANGPRHGTHTLSTIVGFRDGELVGPAFGAMVILAKTEDAASETPIEEDNFVAGLEWVELMGADVVSTSLGYYLWYEYSDLDGDTAVCTIAADEAVSRGLCVVNSAGNTRGDEDWPHVSPPADGHDVIAIGAVDLDGQIAPFSSPGPTFDGRIKPDLSAQGVGNFVASYYDPESYRVVNGTSFSAPLTAGVAALVLQRVPTLTPLQVREALRETASRASAPDNDYGWGIVDAYAAATYWCPAIEHEPLPDTEDTVGPYPVLASITSRQGLAAGTTYLYWRVNGEAWNQVELTLAGGDQYGASIPGQAGGSRVEYYLQAGDVSGTIIELPHAAPERVFGFEIDVDVVAPELSHTNLIDQVPALWPPTVTVTATDNIGIDRVELTYLHNGGSEEGPFLLSPIGDDSYEMDFPLPASSIQVGDDFSYQVTAWDTAGKANGTTSGSHDFIVVGSLGEILIVDNNPFSSTAADIAQWIEAAGYTVEVIDDSEVNTGSFLGYDAVVVACGNNGMPLAQESLRAHIINWVDGGGRVMIESGEIGRKALAAPGYPEFAEKVLHADEWWGDQIGTIPFHAPADQAYHYFLNRPHRLPSPISMEMPQGSGDLFGCDLVLGANDAQVILHSLYNANSGGVVIYDDNTGPEAGQIVYLTFDIGYMTPGVAEPFMANAMAYLTSREAPGQGSISGRVILADGHDASGVVVSIDNEHNTVTDPEGVYTLEGLHGSTYTVTAALEGYGPGQRTIRLMADQALLDIDFTLYAVQQINEVASPNQDIPDYDPDGISSVINVAAEGFLHGISIDIDISHASIGNLVVTLTSPQGTTVTLHNRTGGTSDDLVGNWPAILTVDGPGELADFTGENVAGQWTLTVADELFGGLGTFNTWGLNLLVGTSLVSDVHDDLPASTRFLGNAPNPFNPQTVIAFDLAVDGRVRLDVFDLRGRHIRNLQSGDLAAGSHRFTWGGRDDSGRGMSSGVYFCRLDTGGRLLMHKMMLVR